ncbi:MAG: biotin--[acetyl-CoA-carboxylase] ligase, partial [Alphaproteobacteria bacterium]
LLDGYRAVILDEVDSTNEEAKRRAEAGEAGGLFILARAQTAGRGRRGREWVSPKGNLFATLLLRPQVTPQKAAELSFVAANAVAETFESLGAFAVTVKWPNDVLLGGAKAAGILLESSARNAASLDWLAIGMGLNLQSAPTGTPYPATSLKAETGRVPPDPAEALPILAAHWARGYEGWEREGFARVRAGWLARAEGLGKRIIARLEAEEMHGNFIDLSETGELVLDTPQGRRLISAGEIFFARNN